MKQIKKIISGSLLIAGTAIGAGMLGIPMITADSGFIPATFITLAVWAFMLITGLLLLEVTLKMPSGSNILSITEKFLGKPGKIFAGITFIFLYYCLIVAYIAGGSPLLDNLLNIEEIPMIFYYLFFTFIVASIVYLGVKWIDRLNIILSVSMLLAFVLMFTSGSSTISYERLTHPLAFEKMFFAVPILFGAFGYHNVIPSLCDYLKRDKPILRLSIIIGTLLALIIYLVWQYLVMGSVDRGVLEHAMYQGLTSISALEQATNNPSLFFYGKWFGSLALLTSLLGVSLSMVDFFADGLSQLSKKIRRFWLCLITFLPPLIFTLFNPNVFTKALSLAGGIGESILNGLLPVCFIWVSHYYMKGRFTLKELSLLFLFILGLSVMYIEIYDLLVSKV